MKISDARIDGSYLRVSLERDGKVRRKTVKFVSTEFDSFIFDLELVRKEADRDISMLLHGDSVHCEDIENNLSAWPDHRIVKA